MVSVLEKYVSKFDSSGKLCLPKRFHENLDLIPTEEKGIEFILGGLPSILEKQQLEYAPLEIFININQHYDKKIWISEYLRKKVSDEKGNVIFFDFGDIFRLYSPINAEKYLNKYR